MLTHVVLMALTDPNDAAEARQRLLALTDAVDSLRSLEVGVANVGPPSRFHLALHTTHDDEAGLSDYQQHPAHVEVLAWLKPRLVERAAVDWID